MKIPPPSFLFQGRDEKYKNAKDCRKASPRFRVRVGGIARLVVLFIGFTCILC
jgi:hypothetical protein